jgi:hypothetical protein
MAGSGEAMADSWTEYQARMDGVASRGGFSSVSVITCSTCASVSRRGVPGRGSSTSPSKRFSTKRRRQRPTVCRVDPQVGRHLRIRSAGGTRQDDLRAPGQALRRGPSPRPLLQGVRSLGLTVTRTVGRPRFAIRASLYQKYEARGQ